MKVKFFLYLQRIFCCKSWRRSTQTKAFLGAVAFCLCSCGFVPANRSLNQLQSICVDPICSDPQGSLRAILARELVHSGFFYSSNCPDLTVCVEIVSLCDENIGFRYDHDSEGMLTKTLIPAETRSKITCQVVVVDKCCQTVMGPCCISEEIDFDHDFYQNYDAVNVFSLGQVTDIEAAKEVALRPLYTKLSKKITRYIGGSR